MISPVDTFLKLEHPTRDRIIAVAASVLFHIFLLIIVIAFSGDSRDVKRMPTAIDVDLMYVQAPPAKKKTKVQTRTKKKKQKVRKKTVKKKKKAVSLNKKKTIKKKKKVVKSKDIINDAINRLKKDLAEDTPEKKVKDRLASLKKEIVNKDEEPHDIVDASTSPPGDGRRQLLGAQYSSYVIAAVQKNWAFSKNLAAGSKSLKTWIVIKVRADGEIISEEIIKPSGNSYMDSTASMAIKRSNPLKSFPEGLKSKYIEIELGFEPK